MIKNYSTEVLMYRMTNGDHVQMGYIEQNYTLPELYFWLGISNYINVKDMERLRK